MDPESPRFYDPDWKQWEEPRRWPQRVALILVAAIVVGLFAMRNNVSPTITSTTKPVTSTTFPLPGTGVGQIAPLHFSGNGSQTTTHFTVEGGTTVFDMHCTCAANFAVAVKPAGRPVDVLLNQTRYFFGTQALNLPHGIYSLTVAADLRWTITVTQPRNEQPVTGTSAFIGTGPAVLGPFTLSPNTPVRVVYTPTASSFAAVSYLPTSGGPSTTPFATNAAIDKTTTVGVPSTSTYYVNVNNGGYWYLKYGA
jgi:hypothetical protein